MQSESLLSLLKYNGALLEGHFLLTSGKHSNLYIEKFRILENPQSLNKVCQTMSNLVIKKNIDIVIGAAIGGILIAGGIGRCLDKKHIFSERINGKMELRRGFEIKKNERVLIVEDIVTTGGSIIELIDLVKQKLGSIVHIVSLVNRNASRIDFGFPSSSILNLPSISWEPKDCPLCLKGVPITKRGRTGKKR